MYRRIPAAAILAGVLLAALPGAAGAADASSEADLDRLKVRTVMIDVGYHGDGPMPESGGGTGVLLCYVGEEAWVLTARHVIYGENRSDLDLAKLSLSFYGDLFPAVEQVYGDPAGDDLDEEATTVVRTIENRPVRGKDGKELDLRLLVFKLDGVPSVARPGSLPRDFQETAWRNREITAIGWPQKQRHKTWDVSSGTIEKRDDDGRLLLHKVELVDGYSGGPLFDDTGALIGINLAVKDGQGRSMPIDEALQAIRQQVPRECSQTWGVRTEEEKRKAEADTLYRQAMLAINTKAWGTAATKLGLALQQVDDEGGSVHLQGMRYTEYLPYYYLGLALYHQGTHYGDALKALQTSEVKGVVQGYRRRYRRLKKLKAECSEAIESQNLGKVRTAEGSKV